MKNIYRICIFALLSIGQFGYSQSIDKHISYRFKDKEIGLRKYIQTHLRYPELAISNKIIGFSISSITITPKGDIAEIAIVNPIHSTIDNEVINVLKSTRSYWIENDTIKNNQTFYVQILFTCFGSDFVLDNYNYVRTNSYFIEPLVIMAVPIGNTTNSIPISSDSIAKSCDALITNRKYEEALPFINELIKRYPYSENLYQIRIRVYNTINKKEFINEDLQKIMNFIPGVSLYELLEN